jgi:DNA-binding transcriptional MerR regulator
MAAEVGRPVILLSPMGDISFPIEIPKGTLFKAAEVCDLVKVQPYVLRSWEGEFPGLGVAKTAGGPRVYRRVDIEQVIRIKHLLLVEGLTLAGARRKLEEESAPPMPVEVLDAETRDRLQEIRRGLRSILDLLSSSAPAETPEHTAAAEPREPLIVVPHPSHVSEMPARSAAKQADSHGVDAPEQEWLLSDPADSETAPSARSSSQASSSTRTAGREASKERARPAESRRKDSGAARSAGRKR